MGDDIRAAKKFLRKTIISIGQQIPANDVETESSRVTSKVLAAEWYRNAKRLSIYVSTAGEVNTDTLVKKSLEAGKEVFIPYFEKGCKSMDMLRLTNIEQFHALTSTLFGIRQHANRENTERWTEHGPLDLILYPGVAFTKDGRRLGHGMGYYDRFVAEHQKMYGSTPFSAGLALKYQLVPDIPTTPSDYKLDCVISSD